MTDIIEKINKLEQMGKLLAETARAEIQRIEDERYELWMNEERF